MFLFFFLFWFYQYPWCVRYNLSDVKIRSFIAAKTALDNAFQNRRRNCPFAEIRAKNSAILKNHFSATLRIEIAEKFDLRLLLELLLFFQKFLFYRIRGKTCFFYFSFKTSSLCWLLTLLIFVLFWIIFIEFESVAVFFRTIVRMFNIVTLACLKAGWFWRW